MYSSFVCQVFGESKTSKMANPERNRGHEPLRMQLSQFPGHLGACFCRTAHTEQFVNIFWQTLAPL